MRITRYIVVLATLAGLSLSTPAFAQDEKGDPQAPPTGAQTFGPRANKGQPAQQGGGQRPQAETVATHGAWAIQCTEGKGPDGKPAKSCGMVQQSHSEKNEKVAVSVIVRKISQGDKSAVFMQVMAPMGVFLPTGIPIEIDGAALPKPMIFNRCVPPICEAAGEASAESLDKFRKGSQATFYIYDRPGNGFPLKISLEGFAAGLKALDGF
ncbi:MAG: invasion associated locus B family protein [Proteobacteria bacterium]|nr:invasion associated locus B family protein [Pseudomonadota bacterium]